MINRYFFNADWGYLRNSFINKKNKFWVDLDYKECLQLGEFIFQELQKLHQELY